jgi:hypothetical protein
MFGFDNILHVGVNWLRSMLYVCQIAIVVGQQKSLLLGNRVEEFGSQLGFFGEVSVIT